MSGQLMDGHYDMIVSYAHLFHRSVCECTHVCLHNCLSRMGTAVYCTCVMTSRLTVKEVLAVWESVSRISSRYIVL